jgi:hypothetical protein
MHCLLVEEYLLAAFVEYCKASAALPKGRVRIEYLFDSDTERWYPDRAAQAGFTHLVADAKRNPQLAVRLENRVRRDYPELYERCSKVATMNA